MVQVGDWVKIHEDAVGVRPFPTAPVKVTDVSRYGICVDRGLSEGEGYFYDTEYDVVSPPYTIGDPPVGTNPNEWFMPAETPDLVNRPIHYKIKDDFEVIDVIEALAKDDAWYANAIKYLLRAKKKGKFEQDLGKCKFYIDRMLRDAESGSK